MLYRLFPFTFLLLGASVVFSQTPQNILLEKSHMTGMEKAFACQDQFAGTIDFDNFIGHSNDIDPDTIFLCEGDAFDVVHNGDADLTGDPNAATTPGVTYIWYDCPPTVNGPDLNTILTDGCIFTGPPPPTNGFYVTAGGNFNGNQTFNNSGALQTTFNGGDPLLLWFAPITIDNFSLKQYENDANGINGPCVNVNTNEAFAVVYLNEIELTNLNPNTGTSGCSGQVTVSGGLPEFDGSDYTVEITLMGNPSVQGTVTNGPVTHNDIIRFDVPAPGLYEIIIEDGKSCADTLTANMTGCVNLTQSIESTVAAPGDNICLDVTVEDGFDAIQSVQFALTFDPAILQYTGIQNITPLLPGFNPSSFSFQNDTVRISWFQGIGSSSLPDSTVLFEICFDVIGSDGTCTNVDFVEIGPITDIEIIDANGNELGFNGISGLACVSNSALQATAVQDSVSCPGGMDGGFTVTVTGSTPPYNVTWQNAAGGPVNGPGVINVDGDSFTVSNLPAGNYIITVVDNSATPITAIEQVEVFGPPMLNLLFSANQGQCSGDLGSVSATLILDSVIVSNPTQNYSFLWSTGGTTTTISGITSGNYMLTVTENGTNCSVEGMVFLPQPAGLDVTIQIDSATCTGIPDGVISVNVSGGMPDAGGNYEIELGPSTVTNTSASLMTESGDHMLEVTDANGCTFEQLINLPAIKILSITPTIENVACNNDCTGSISAQGTTDGGTPAIPYTFTWSGNPNPPPSIDQPTNSTLNDLCIGTYMVIMEDTDGCSVDSTFTVIQPSPIDVTIINVTNETCQPGMDGSITIGVTGGSYPYTYEWGIPSLTDSTATGLSAGMYTVTVRDALGCFTDITAEVQMPAPPVIQELNDDMIDCFEGTDGTLTVVPADPLNILQTTWSNTGIGNTITGLSPGEYIVTITDFNQCTAVDTALVTSPPELVLDSTSLTSPNCIDDNTGEIIVFVSGGTPNYTFDWSDPAGPTSGSVFGAASAGNNSVTITDANGCEPLEIDLFLPDPPFIEATFAAIDSVSCATGMSCDGTATATAMYSDGTIGTYNFTWLNSGEMTNNSIISTAVQLCQGTQPVIIADLNCHDTFFVDIPAPPPIVPGVTIENVSCNGLSDGEITVMPSGGTPPYSIVWGNGVIGPVISGLPAGSYTANITDSKNCTFPHTIVVIEPDPFVLGLNGLETTTQVSCNGDEDGVIGVIAQGGNAGNITYFWENNVGTLDSPIAENLPAGTYSVTAVDSKGCEAELSYTIAEPPPIDFLLDDPPTIDCFGGNTSITVDSAWGGSGVLQFSVDGGPPQFIGQTIGGLIAREYTITVLDANATDCKTSKTIEITQPPEILVSFVPDVVEIELGDSLTCLDPDIIPPIPIDSFIWSPPDRLSCTNCKNPKVNPIDDQLYTLVVIDANGCTGMGSVFVDLDRNRNVYIPNVFSPNADGLNDDFRVFTGPGVTAINFVRVYDRWGELVHEVLTPPLNPVQGTAEWDGTFNGDEMNPAVFLYLIEVEFIDGQVLLYRGDVSLIR